MASGCSRKSFFFLFSQLSFFLAPITPIRQRGEEKCVISCVMSWEIGLSNLWSSGSDFTVKLHGLVASLSRLLSTELWEFIALEWVLSELRQIHKPFIALAIQQKKNEARKKSKITRFKLPSVEPLTRILLCYSYFTQNSRRENICSLFCYHKSLHIFHCLCPTHTIVPSPKHRDVVVDFDWF